MNEFNAKGMKWYQVITTLVLGVIVCSLFGSCRSQYIDITDDMFIYDTVYVTKLQQERIYQHDSIFTDRYYCSDTAYIVREKWTVQVKEKLVHDSIYINHTDTIIKKVPVEVAPKESRWQKFMGDIGELCAWLVVIFLLAVLVMSVLNKKLPTPKE